MATRFVFVFFAAKFLDPSELGYYGLFAATISYGLYIIGLDFYAFLSREVIAQPAENRGRLIKGQFFLAAVSFFVTAPVFIFVVGRSGWPGGLEYWFFVILVLEYVNQEWARLLIVLSKQFTASLVMLLRQGSWAVFVVLAMAWEPATRSLGFVMAAWCFAGLAAACMGMVAVLRTGIGGWRRPVDWQWVWKGLRISAFFLLATLSLRAVQTVDRYWVEALGGIEIVAAYVLFMGIAGTLLALLDASVFSYGYPALIARYHRKEYSAAHQMLRAMLIQTVVACLAFSLASWILLPVIVDWVDKPIYREGLPLYPWLLAAMVLNAIGMVPHYGLYAAGHDRPIIQSHIAALPAFASSVLLLANSHAILAVPIGLNVSFALILVWKSVAYLRAEQNRRQVTPHS